MHACSRVCVCVRHEERGTVWQDLATVYKSLANFRRFISHLIWQNAEPTLANSLHYWANFQCFEWPNIENNLTIWSHLRGRRFFSLVPFKLNSRYWSTYLPTYLAMHWTWSRTSQELKGFPFWIDDNDDGSEMRFEHVRLSLTGEWGSSYLAIKVA